MVGTEIDLVIKDSLKALALDEKIFYFICKLRRCQGFLSSAGDL
ncbi:hypothetical protein [Salinicoccus albus]|nr:hypothetical protein [Salinicoccus albus]